MIYPERWEFFKNLPTYITWYLYFFYVHIRKFMKLFTSEDERKKVFLFVFSAGRDKNFSTGRDWRVNVLLKSNAFCWLWCESFMEVSEFGPCSLRVSAYHGIFETKFAMKLIRLERAGAGRKVCCYKIIPCDMVVLSFTEISGPGDRDGIIVQ